MTSGALQPLNFQPSVQGDYEFKLIAQDENKTIITEDKVKVTVGDGNSIPVANAGADQNSNVSQNVPLSGNAYDADGDLLSFEWYFTSKPGSSNTALANASSANASFTPDVVGTYVVTIKVSDGKTNTANAVVSNFDSMVVTVSDVNTPPVAQLGPDLIGDLKVYRNSAVQLYGDKSYDIDAQPLTYAWTLSVKPDNSNASFSIAPSSNKNSQFIPDVTGMYTVQLVVSDDSDSDAATLEIEVDDRAPMVNIISHIDDESITPDGSVTLKGSVNDPEDGKLAEARIKWSSSIDGALGDGEIITVELTPGEHTITLEATDIYNHTTLASLTLNVLEPPTPPEVPTAIITSPVNNQSFPSDGNIVFAGSATDSQGNAITGDSLVWILNQNPIGTGEQIDVKLAAGTHIVTLQATDANDLQGLASITVQVKTNQPPQVSISKPTAQNLFLKDEEITFEGSAIDAEDGVITNPAKYEWSSDKDGVLCQGMSCKKVLSQGEHVVTLSVMDSDGVKGEATVTVNVQTVVVDPNPINCTDGNPCIELINTKTRGQVAYYPFDGNADDASGNGNHGVVNGATLTEDRDGKIDSAYRFDGVDDYIEAPLLTTSINDVSMEVWVYPIELNGKIVYIGNDGSSGYGLYTYNQHSLYNKDGLGVLFGGIDFDAVDSSYQLTKNKWTHIVLVSNKNQWIVYVDSVVTSMGSGTPNIPTLNTQIGGFNGLIDDVRVYDRALSANEIKAIKYNVDYAGTTENTFTINAFVTDKDGVPIADEFISWESNTDGAQLGTGKKLSTKLPTGNHIIRITATSGSVIVVKTFTAYVDEPPTAEIKSPVKDSTYDAGDVIAFTAVADDNEDGDMGDSIVWTSNIDGEIGKGKQLTEELSVGVHTITVTVKDSFGNEVSTTVEMTVNGNVNFGLVAYYPFNGNANDASGNENDGTMNGAVLTEDRFGNTETSYSFDGASSKIVVSDNTILRLANSSFTISVWINEFARNDSFLDSIIAKRGVDNGNGNGWIYGISGKLENTVGHARLHVSGGTDPFFQSSSEVSLSKWQHTVVSYSLPDDKLHIHVDSELDLIAQGVPNINPNTNTDLVIGSDSGTSKYFFHGSIDDVRIYNRALTEGEIQTLYNEGGWPLK